MSWNPPTEDEVVDKKSTWTPPKEDAVVDNTPTITMDKGEAEKNLVDVQPKSEIEKLDRPEGVIDIPKGGVGEIRRLNEAKRDEENHPSTTIKKDQVKSIIDRYGNVDSPEAKLELQSAINPQTELTGEKLTDNQQAHLLDFSDKYLKEKPRLDKITKQINENPNNQELRVEAGDSYNRIGDFSQAINSYSRANQNGDNWKALNGLGSVYLQMGKDDDAKSSYAAALKSNPENATAAVNMAYIDVKNVLDSDTQDVKDVKNKQIDKEIGFLKQTMPDNYYVYALSAYHNMKKGDNVSANTDYKAAQFFHSVDIINSIPIEDYYKLTAEDSKKNFAQIMSRMQASPVEVPFQTFANAELGAAQQVGEGLTGMAKGVEGFRTGRSLTTSTLNFINGGINTAFGTAMALDPQMNFTFAAAGELAPEVFNKVMQPADWLLGLNEKDKENLSENKKALLGICNALGGMALFMGAGAAKKSVLNKLASGDAMKLSPDDINGIKNGILRTNTEYSQHISDIRKSIPEDVGDATSLKLFLLMEERANIERQKTNTKEVFHPMLDEKIKAIDENVNSILKEEQKIKQLESDKAAVEEERLHNVELLKKMLEDPDINDVTRAIIRKKIEESKPEEIKEDPTGNNIEKIDSKIADQEKLVSESEEGSDDYKTKKAVLDELTGLREDMVKGVEDIKTTESPEIINEPKGATEKTSDKFVEKPVSEIKTDENRFQNRTELDQEHVKNIADNWNDNELDPVVIWKGDNGDSYILAGHHRLEAAKMLGKETIDARYFKGTEAEAIEYAKGKSNANRRMEAPHERAAIYRKMREDGKTEDEIKQALQQEGKNKVFIDNVSYLNPNGKAMTAMKSFAKAGDTTTINAIQKVADWVGQMKKDHPDLTNLHEDEIYDFVQKNEAKSKDDRSKIRTKAELSDLINRRVNGVDEFSPEETLNFEHKVGRGANEIEQNSILDGLKREKAAAISEIKKIQAKGKSITPEEQAMIKNLSRRVIDIESKEIPDAQKRVSQAREGDKKQIDIFTQINENIKDGNIKAEDADRFINEVEKADKDEAAIKDIENKAGSDSKDELNEVIKKADELLGAEDKMQDGSQKASLEPKDGDAVALPPQAEGATPKEKPLTETEKSAKKLADAKKKLGDKLRGGMQMGGLGAIPEFIEYVKAFVEHAGNKIEDFIKKFREDFPESKHTDDDLRSAFNSAAKGGEEKTPDPEMTKMANAVHDEFVQGKFGIDALLNVISKLGDTDVKRIYEATAVKIKKGLIDLNKRRKELMNTLGGSEEDQAAMLYDAAELKGKERGIMEEIQNETDQGRIADLQRKLLEVQSDMLDNALANRNLGRSASNMFRLRQLWADESANLANMTESYKAGKGIKELTPEQTKEINDSYNKLVSLENEIKKLREDLKKSESEAEGLRKQNDVLNSLKEEAKKQRRSDRGLKAGDAINKSKARVQSALDRMRARRGQLSALVNPEDARDIAIIAKEKVYQGAVRLDELVKNILDEIKDFLPNFTEKDVIDHLLYKKENKPASDESKILSTIKKTADITGKTERGEFTKPEKELKEKSDRLKKAEEEYSLARYEWEKARRMDLMSRQPIPLKIADMLVNWTRFSILSYPSTILKLVNVVVQGALTKPLKFAAQGLAYGLQKGAFKAGLLKQDPTLKQGVWDKPRIKALAAYYASFRESLSLQNLKDHFSGVDRKELMYGKKFHYDEFGLASGFFATPGRSHGYIKSFIKNAEYKFAKEQISEHYIEKMGEIMNKLDDPNLTTEQRASLEQEFKQYDVTNKDVEYAIGVLSHEHGKWSILMNDNKFTKGLNELFDKMGISGKLLRTEFPIVKIPLNFIGRSFSVQYGLVRALAGGGLSPRSPGLVELMFKGTKELSPKDAELLGRSLTMGTIGASFFMLGYLNRKNIQVNEDGSLEVFGVHVPKLFTHYPEYESIISGALVGGKMEEQGNADGFMNGMAKASFDIAKNNPFTQSAQWGALGGIAEILNGKDKNEDGWKTKVAKLAGKEISKMFIPGVVKEWADAKDKYAHGRTLMDKTITRKTTGDPLEQLWQEIELGIPGYREDVKSSEEVKMGKRLAPKVEKTDYETSQAELKKATDELNLINELKKQGKEYTPSGEYEGMTTQEVVDYLNQDISDIKEEMSSYTPIQRKKK